MISFNFRFRGLLGPSWETLWGPLGSPGALLGLMGSLGALLGASGLLGHLLGPCWAPVGVLGLPLGALWGASGVFWVPQIALGRPRSPQMAPDPPPVRCPDGPRWSQIALDGPRSPQSKCVLGSVVLGGTSYLRVPPKTTEMCIGFCGLRW